MDGDTEDPSAPLLPPAADEDDDVDEDPFEVLARTSPSPESVPWEQRSTTMKVVHVADRVFLFFMAIFLLLLMGEVSYILYHILPWAGILHYFMQEEGEEEFEL